MRRPVRSALARAVEQGALLPEGESARWGAGGEPPQAVVAPSSEEEMARVLALASGEGWRVLPAGLGGWLDGGGALEADLVVSTGRLRGIREYEPADLTFTAWAGTSLDELQGIFRERGQWLPLDPPGGEAGSLGAMVALGGAGPLQQGYGTPRDHVLGLTLVTGDGRILRWGGRVVKNVAGFDLTRLCIGSWGTLGIITSVSARLFPVPAHDVTLVLAAPAAEDLLPAARAIALSPLPLAAIELLDPLPAEEEARAGLVLRLMGSLAQVESLETRVQRALGHSTKVPGSASGAFRRTEGGESRAFHRRLAEWEDGADLVLRLALLPSRLGTLVEEARELSNLPCGAGRGDRPDVRLAAHVGAGILRVAVRALPEDQSLLARWAGALAALRGRLERAGGGLKISVGPPGIMRDVGAWRRLGAEGAIVQGLQGQFDPRGVLAPGRMPPGIP